MKTPYDIIISLLRTEKGTTLLPFNKYTFLVNMCANKHQIKKAIEEIYNVTVVKLNTSVVSGKSKRVRYKTGKTPDWKKAVATLKQGNKIEIT